MIFSCAVSFESKKKKIPDLSLPPCISTYRGGSGAGGAEPTKPGAVLSSIFPLFSLFLLFDLQREQTAD
jgi:hypothetical protein